MKRIAIYLLFISLALSGRTQDKVYEIRSDFSELLYSIKATSPSISLLDKITNAYQSFGDKDMIREMITEDLIFTDPTDFQTGYDVLKIGLTARDTAALQALPALAENIREVPYTIFISLIMGRSINEDMPFLKSFFSINTERQESFPNLAISDMRKPNRYQEELKNHGIFLQWAVSYPAEAQNMARLFMDEFETWRAAGHPKADVEDYRDFLFRDFTTNSIYRYFIPVGIEQCIQELTIPRSSIPSQRQMLADPEAFISKAYKDIRHRAATTEETDMLKDFILTNKDVRPETIYYALILTGFE